jgi:prenyltransferase beta subunit
MVIAWRVLPAFLLLLASAAGQAGPAPSAAPKKTAEPVASDSIQRAIRWLISAQNRDGSWGLDARSPGDPTCTVVAALALMANGTTERGGPEPERVEAVRKAVEYILRLAREMRAEFWPSQVTLIQNKLGHNVHTFFAAVFLTQVYGMRGTWVRENDLEELRDRIGKMVDQIVKSQEPDGSWHKNTFGSLKATCMAWLALRSAASSGLDVERASVRKIIAFIKTQWNKDTKLFDKMTGNGNYQTIYATACSLRVLYGMGQGDSPEAKGATEAFLDFVKKSQMSAAFLTVEGEDYLSAALVTQALIMDPDQRWNAWFPWIQAELVKRQAKDGTWTSTACITGRTFPTACALLTLQAPYRQLPIGEQ